MSALGMAADDEDSDMIGALRREIASLCAQSPTAWLISDHSGRLGGGQWVTQRSSDLCDAHDQGCEITPLYAKSSALPPRLEGE